MENFKTLLKETTKAVNRANSIRTEDNKAEALLYLEEMMVAIEAIEVKSPEEIAREKLTKLTKAELVALLLEEEPKPKTPKVTKPKATKPKATKPKAKKTSKKKSKKRKKKAVHDNGRLARKARVTRNSNQRLDDLATKQSLDKLFDNAMALRY